MDYRACSYIQLRGKVARLRQDMTVTDITPDAAKSGCPLISRAVRRRPDDTIEGEPRGGEHAQKTRRRPKTSAYGDCLVCARSPQSRQKTRLKSSDSAMPFVLLASPTGFEPVLSP
jgi:hypothetical protein